MTRDFVINGETLVRLRFGAHLPASISNIPGSSSNLSELGLSSQEIRISPKTYHYDIRADDYGGPVPAETLWNFGECSISMELCHWDKDILDVALAESMGGSLLGNQFANGISFAGTLAPAGTPMAGQSAYLASGYHYCSLSLLSPQLQRPYHFPSAWLADNPMELPLGTERSLVRLNWRAIPLPNTTAQGDVFSSGAVLWDHSPDLT